MWAQDLVAKPTDEYGKGLVVLLSPGLANILALCTHAAGIPKLCQDDNEN